MKIVDNVNVRRNIYMRTKSSNLYDKKLSMYYICGDLSSMRQDLGRMVAFSPGWLENQSIWLHMSYKFYLEVRYYTTLYIILYKYLTNIITTTCFDIISLVCSY
jgi:hypothetical protein